MSHYQQVRHLRIMELRKMALKGCSMDDLHAKCVSWKVSYGTAASYINEVRESILKVIAKQQRSKLK